MKTLCHGKSHPGSVVTEKRARQRGECKAPVGKEDRLREVVEKLKGGRSRGGDLLKGRGRGKRPRRILNMKKKKKERLRI